MNVRWDHEILNILESHNPTCSKPPTQIMKRKTILKIPQFVVYEHEHTPTGDEFI